MPASTTVDGLIACRRIRIVQDLTFADPAAMLSDAEAIPMGCAWGDAGRDHNLGAWVRTGWEDGHLWVYAVMDDACIYNPVTSFNEPSFQLGDVFEMFIRPDGQDVYYELHVNPNNARMQLRIPSADVFYTHREEPGIPSDWFVYEWQFESRVEVDANLGQWRVLARIPRSKVEESGPVDAWHVSFSRYDYAAPGAVPVLTSTSAHTGPDFHHQACWRRLVFIDS